MRKGENVADFTKKAIKETFIKLIEEHPLSKITIKDIVEECGINRNTFYYHYKDLPALIEEILKDEADATIEKYNTISSILECYDALTEFASNKKRAIMHIFRSVSRDVFEHHLMNIGEYFISCYVEHALKDELVAKGIKELGEEDKKSIIEYFKCVSFGLVIEWLNNGMDEERAKSIRKIFQFNKSIAMDFVTMLNSQN